MVITLSPPTRPGRGWAASLMLLCGLGCAAPALAASCDDILPPPAAVKPAHAKRDIVPEDLMRLRDIGYPDGAMITADSPLALSPDGSKLAFVITRAEPASNIYCRALVVMPVRSGARPRIVDQGGALIRITEERRGLVQPNGFPAQIIPAWSPDGQWIAYLRRDHGVTQAWRARADGQGAQAVTHSPSDVETVRWSDDGRRLLIARRPGRLAAKEAIDREGDHGFLFDARVVPGSGPSPQLPGGLPVRFSAVDPETGVVEDIAPAEAPGLSPAPVGYGIRHGLAIAANGMRAWLRPETDAVLGPLRIWTAAAGQAERPCLLPACLGYPVTLSWSADGRELRYWMREGWGRADMALYRWVPGKGAPRRVFRTRDVVQGCLPASGQFICLREGSARPRHIVLIDPLTGQSSTVFDPNPEFSNLRLGKVERIAWKNHLGLESWADLVLPPGHDGKGKLPMVVVQYRSQGFLRGGSGDEYPIFTLAARGFAVMSFNRPAEYASLVPDVRTFDQVDFHNARQWNDRRSVLSALETGIALIVGRGIADPDRIGISGLSDGATTTRFALINTRLFKAAVLSTCCTDMTSLMITGGIALANDFQADGYPSSIEDRPAFWKALSLVPNAAAINVPILMQLADAEYLGALASFTALREHRKPVEMYVYPDEYHAKWQPIHRLSVYRRNIQWFAFWLKGEEEADPGLEDQYRRWRAMREDLTTSPAEG